MTHKNHTAGQAYQPDIYYCPYCGHSLKENKSLIVEYWDSLKNVFFCWCQHCEWRGEVSKINQVTTSELNEK